MARLRIGLIPPGEGKSAIALREAFVSSLTDALGEPVEAHDAADYRSLAAALTTGVAHLGWMPPLVAARALRSGQVQAAVVVVRNGMTSYSTCLVTLAKSNLLALSDLTGTRAAWVDRESTSGYLLIRAALRAEGIAPVSAFSEELFVRSHTEVARALIDGRADVGATFLSFQSGTREIARAGWRAAGLDDDEVRVLLHAGPIPSDVFLVNNAISGSHLKALQAALADARPALTHQLAKELLHADAFVRATTDHTAMLEDLLTRLDVPLASWLPPRMDRTSSRPPR